MAANLNEDRLPGTQRTADDTVGLFDRLAAEYDSWYQTPLGALAHTLEQQAIYFPPINSATLLTVLRWLERPGRRWLPGMAAFLAAAGNRVMASNCVSHHASR